MAPTPEIIAALNDEELEFARQQTPGEKILAGPDLFDLACMMAIGGIRMQNPGADEETVQRILAERLELGRRLDEHAPTD